jgi:hypothetical protein
VLVTKLMAVLNARRGGMAGIACGFHGNTSCRRRMAYSSRKCSAFSRINAATYAFQPMPFLGSMPEMAYTPRSTGPRMGVRKTGLSVNSAAI